MLFSSRILVLVVAATGSSSSLVMAAGNARNNQQQNNNNLRQTQQQKRGLDIEIDIQERGGADNGGSSIVEIDIKKENNHYQEPAGAGSGSDLEGAIILGPRKNDNNDQEPMLTGVPLQPKVPVQEPATAAADVVVYATAGTCADLDCNKHPDTGSFVQYTTCEEIDNVGAVCGCEYTTEFGDQYPKCFGPTQDCDNGFYSGTQCVDSICYNWCDTISMGDTICNAGYNDGECCDISNCENLICNPNYRENGPEPRCTCSVGEIYHIDLTPYGSQYLPASGCAVPNEANGNLVNI